MPTDERKLREYYNLKKAIEVAQTKLNKLNVELKKELEPGVHTIGGYKVDLNSRDKYNYDYNRIPDDVFYTCLIEVVDPQLIESAYLRGALTDDEIREIRGEIETIQSLKVDRVKETEIVQTNL